MTFTTGEADHPKEGDLIIMQCVRHDPPWCDLKMVRVDGPVFRPVPCKHGEMDEHLHEWWSERWKRWGQTECSGGEWVEVK